MVSEIENDPLVGPDLASLRSIEPWWKLLVSNKAMLPLLWSMYPNHPSLLPSYYSDPREELSGDWDHKYWKDWISKPILGREGQGFFRSNNFTSYEDFKEIT